MRIPGLDTDLVSQAAFDRYVADAEQGHKKSCHDIVKRMTKERLEDGDAQARRMAALEEALEAERRERRALAASLAKQIAIVEGLVADRTTERGAATLTERRLTRLESNGHG